MDSQTFWDERYRQHQHLWSGQPNPVLCAEAARLRPGRALEVGCGEGADALWLAANGWAVTGIDVSAVAIERANAHLAERAEQDPDLAAKVRFTHRDIVADGLPGERFDLVSSHYLHLPSGLRRTVYPGLARAVAPGGHLLVVGHDRRDAAAGVPRPPVDVLFDVEELVGVLRSAQAGPGKWEVGTAEARERIVERDGREITLYDVVLFATRLA